MDTRLVNEKRDMLHGTNAIKKLKEQPERAVCEALPSGCPLRRPVEKYEKQERITPLEAKPVCWTDATKDPQTFIGADARPTKRIRNREGLKSQASWLPRRRYSKEKSFLIYRLSGYDSACRRFLFIRPVLSNTGRKCHR